MLERIGLYYPFIHFPSDEWVKLAALYWARMGRIVPPGYHPTRDSPVVQALADEFVRNFSPAPAVAELNAKFTDVLTSHEVQLRDKYGVNEVRAWQPDPVTLQRMKAAAVPLENVDPEFAYLYAEKIAPDLLARLVDAGLAVAARGDDPSWIGVHPSVARVYMTALADGMASASEERVLHPVTDDAFDHVAVSGWTVERLSAALLDDQMIAANGAETPEPTVGLAFVAIRVVIPNDLSAVPVERIIEVRRMYGTELTRFVDSIRAFGKELEPLSSVNDPLIFQEQLAIAYHDRIRPQLDALRHDLALFKIDTTLSAIDMKVAAPAALTSVAAEIGTHVDPVIGVGSGVAVGIARLIQSQHVRAANLMADSPAAYLLRLEEGLQPASLLQRIHRRVRKFVCGI